MMKNSARIAKILVVDDNKDLTWLVKEILKEEDIKVDIGNNAESTLEKIKEHQYAMLILDYKLKGISGLRLLEEARQLNPCTKAILMSAYCEPSVKQKANELQVYGFLDKPFAIGELVNIVKEAIKDGEAMKDD